MPRRRLTHRPALILALLAALPALTACWSSARTIPPRLTGADVPAPTFLAHLDAGDLAAVTVYGDGTMVATVRPGHIVAGGAVAIRTHATLDLPTWTRLDKASHDTQTPVTFDQEQ